MAMNAEHLECLVAMQEFCDRCDRGLARSPRTYAVFKEIIDRHTGRTVDASAEATLAAWLGSPPHLDPGGGAQPEADVPPAA